MSAKRSSGFNGYRLAAIARKETYQIFRDPSTLLSPLFCRS